MFPARLPLSPLLRLLPRLATCLLPSQPGINPRTLSRVFEQIQERKATYTYAVRHFEMLKNLACAYVMRRRRARRRSCVVM